MPEHAQGKPHFLSLAACWEKHRETQEQVLAPCQVRIDSNGELCKAGFWGLLLFSIPESWVCVSEQQQESLSPETQGQSLDLVPGRARGHQAEGRTVTSGWGKKPGKARNTHTHTYRHKKHRRQLFLWHWASAVEKLTLNTTLLLHIYESVEMLGNHKFD